jgi:putative endonuclease
MKAVERRARTYDAGHFAESFAVATLIVKGYRILSRRWRSRSGEVDIVALSPGWGSNRTLVFVEVKRRGDFDIAAESIRVQQRRRIMRAADTFVGSHPRFARTTRRFDIVLVAPRRWPLHVVDAWQADDACV